GKFIPALEKLLSRWPPETVYFLGDADTALIFAFSLEAVKLAKVLPNNCSLRLPRIPFNMPNGIDDCRESLGNEFPAFWEKIKTDAIEVDQRLPAGALATKLATRELPAIAKSANN